MSDNKFILQLKGQQTPKSVVEIKNDKLVAPFVNVPNSSDAVGSIIQDKDSSVVVAKGADVWKLNGGSLVPATNLSGNGSDYTGEYAVSGNMLWVNSTHTFSDTKIFTPNTKWVLQLCGKNLNAGNGDTIDFSFIVKIGSTNIMTKTVIVSEQANFFCKRFVLDFSESIQTAIKAEKNTSLIVQLLCANATASATIYNGMTTLTALQRRVDGDAVASDTKTFEELETITDDHVSNKNNPHEVTKAQVGLGNCDNTSDLDKPISTATQTALNGKVNIDGTSIMTGLLKMRASSSFQCAIAPFWDGVGFYKLNSDDSVTLIASIETPDGFLPWVTNTYNIGSSLKKWKNLYLAGKAYMSVINNGYDIAIPVTNSADTLALKSEVDLAANSGRMITDQGVWYAKMYAATVAPAAEDGTNYADFSQTDGQGNPIIVIYERQSGAWVQSETITPPAEYDGYVPITSKIWDITEQAGQQGGRILWNHQSKEFTPYPQIISLEDAALTGTPTAPTLNASSPSDQIVNKQTLENAIGNGTITITQGGETKGTFTTNQGGNTTINLDAGGGADTIDAELHGSLTVLQNGDVSGTGSSKWINIPGRISFDQNFEILLAFTTPQDYTAGEAYLFAADVDGWKPTGNRTITCKIHKSNNQYFLRFRTPGTTTSLDGTTPLNNETKYYVKIVRSGDDYTVYLSTNGTTFSSEITVTSNDSIVEIPYTISAFDLSSNNPTTIHLAECYIKLSNIIIWTGKSVSNLHQRAPAAHVVVKFQAPTAGNNYTWYRKYDDGWVEQGGYVHTTDGNTWGTKTVALPVEMADTEYTLVISSQMPAGDFTSTSTAVVRGITRCGFTNKTTTSFDGQKATTFSWQVSGMAAS